MKLKLTSNILPITLMVAGSLLLVLVLLAVSRPAPVSAFGSYLTSAKAKYPVITTGSKLDSCLLCHTTATNPSALNAYGTAFGGSNNHNFTTIENLDSDGDGFTNLQEITALTFPGDASDHPVVVVMGNKIFLPMIIK